MSGYRETLDVLGRLQARERGRAGAAPEADRAPHQTGGEPGAQPGAQPGGQTPGRSERALLALERPRRRKAPIGVAALVLAAAGAVAYGIATVRPHHGNPAAHRSEQSSTTTTTTTTTTLPASYQPVSSAASSATYAPVTASYSLGVGATTRDCWISVTTADGKTVVAKTFTPGSSTVVPVTGRASIDLGAPTAASISVDGVRIALPPGMVGPFTVTLVPR